MTTRDIIVKILSDIATWLLMAAMIWAGLSLADVGAPYIAVLGLIVVAVGAIRVCVLTAAEAWRVGSRGRAS